MTEALRGIGEVFQNLVYELVGLIIPGGTILFLVTFLTGTHERAVVVATENPWLAVAFAYVLGSVVQGISRPIVVAGALVRGAVTGLPTRVLGWASERAATRLGALQDRAASSVAALHRPPVPTPHALEAIQRRIWSERFGEDARALGSREILDLSYAALPDTRRLDRFRAATSFSRAIAAVAAVGVAIIVTQGALGLRPWDREAALWIGGLVVSFFGLVERATHFNSIWEAIVRASFVARAATPHVDAGADRERIDGAEKRGDH